MISYSMAILAGPSLMMALATVALLVAWYNLSRAAHVLLWTVAFGLATVRWVIAAYLFQRGLGHDAHYIWLLQVLGLAAAGLLAEGFRLRANVPPTRLTPLGWTVGIAGTPLLALFGPPSAAAVFASAAEGATLMWAATNVATVGRRGSSVEWLVLAMLVTQCLVDFISAGAAAWQMAGFGSSDVRLLFLRYMLLSSCAATGIVAMFLVASDLSLDLDRLVHTDPLTGIMNRTGFERAALEEIRRARRGGRRLSLAVIDIDRFKAINDLHGHATGDAALSHFAARVARLLHRGEVMARIGGEEFALLLPGLDAAGALARVEPIRRDIAVQPVDEHPELRLSASFGIAELSRGEMLPALIARADRALYESKRTGRNRTIVAGEVASAA